MDGRKMATTIWHIVVSMIVFGNSIILTTCENNACLPGKFAICDSCYEPHMKRAATFEKANKMCLHSGGKLAVIRDYITQQFINRVALKTMYENFWIGNANFSSKDCIAIRSQDDYEQKKDDPAQNFFYVCEKDVCSSSSLTGEFNNKCYEMRMERSKCLDAKKSCEKDKGRLAVIDMEEKLQFIQNLIHMNEWWTTVPNSVIEQQYLSDPPIFWSGMKFEQQSKKWTTASGTQDDLFYDYMFSDSILKSDSDTCVTSEFKLIECDKHQYYFCEYSQSLETNSAQRNIVGMETTIAILFICLMKMF